MNPLGISVVRADGSYGYAKYYYYGSPTVYIEVTSINSAGSKWRVRGRNSWGDNEVYLEGQGTGTFTFNSDDNYSYIFQIQNWNNDWVNTSNMGEQAENSIINVNFDSSGGSGGGNTEGGSSQYYYIHYDEGEGTSLIVERTWNEAAQTGYEGIIESGSSILPKDNFDVYVKALDGYKDATVTFYNFDGVAGTAHLKDKYPGYDNWHGTMGGSLANIQMWSSATKIDPDEDDGGSGDNSGGSNSGGSIYIDDVKYRGYIDNGTSWDLIGSVLKNIGTCTTDNNGNATVNCGFKPDLVYIYTSTGTVDNVGTMESGFCAPFSEMSTNYNMLGCGFGPNDTGLAECLFTQTETGFTIGVMSAGYNWNLVPVTNTKFDYKAIKYT